LRVLSSYAERNNSTDRLAFSHFSAVINIFVVLCSRSANDVVIEKAAVRRLPTRIGAYRHSLTHAFPAPH